MINLQLYFIFYILAIIEPMVSVKPITEAFNEMTMGDSNKLLVVLDCANIGWNYGKNELFNVHGLELVLDYFLKVSIICKVVAFIPSSYVRYRPSDGTRGNAKMMTEDIDKLESMIKECRISIVPAGDDDDAYILSYAREHHGYILSNDLYNNHVASIENKHVRDIIRNYLNEFRIGYTFVNDTFYLNPASKLYGLLHHEPYDTGGSGAHNQQPSIHQDTMSTHDYQEDAIEGVYDVYMGSQQGKGNERVKYQPNTRPIQAPQQHTQQQQPRSISSGNQYSNNPSAMQFNPSRQQQQTHGQSYNQPSSQFQPGQQSPFQKQGIEYIGNSSNKQPSQQQQHNMAYNNPSSQNNISAKPASQPAYTRGPTTPPRQRDTRPDIHSTGNTYRIGQNYDPRGADQVSGQMDEEQLIEAQLRKQQDIVHNKMLEVSAPLVYISYIYCKLCKPFKL